MKDIAGGRKTESKDKKISKGGLKERIKVNSFLVFRESGSSRNKADKETGVKKDRKWDERKKKLSRK